MCLRELMICMILSEKNSVDKFYAVFVVTSYCDESMQHVYMISFND